MKSGAIGVSKPFPNHSINPTVGVCGLRGLRSSPPNQCQVQRGAARVDLDLDLDSHCKPSDFRFFPFVLSSQVHIWSWGLGCWRSTMLKKRQDWCFWASQTPITVSTLVRICTFFVRVSSFDCRRQHLQITTYRPPNTSLLALPICNLLKFPPMEI